MPQFARPTGDVAVNSWRNQAAGTTNLYQSIDEASLDTGDYAESGATPPGFDPYEFGLGAVTDPALSAGYVARYALAKDAAGGDTVNAVVQVLQGPTEVARWTHDDLSATPATFGQDLTAAQADAITDHSALRGKVTPIYYLFRDRFTAGLDPAWDATGSLWSAVAGRLRGGGQTSPTWGASDLFVHAGIARATGRTLVAWVLPEDRNADFAVGWASAVDVADPRTDGHAFVTEDGFLEVSQPGTKVTLAGSGTAYDVRPMEHLVVIALNDVGALYLLSTFAAGDGSPALSRTDPRQIAAYPNATVLWRDDANTDAAMHPMVSAYDTLSYQDKLAVDDVRVVDVASWSTPDFGAAVVDRFPSAGTLGSPWTFNGGATWTKASGKISASGGSGERTARLDAGVSDGTFRCRVTIDSTDANKSVGVCFRMVSATSYLLLEMGNAAGADVHSFTGGVYGGLISNQSRTYVAGQTYDVAIVCKGDRFKVFVDGVHPGGDWITSSVHQAGTGIGPFVNAGVTTDAKWGAFVVDPETVALPLEVQAGTGVAAWTVGGTVLTETFTDADGTALPAHDANWISLGGTSDVQSNRGRVTAGAVYATTPDDFEASADVVAPGALSQLRAGLFARYADANNNLVVRLFKDPSQPGTDEIEVVETVAGSTAIQHKTQFASYFSPDQTINLRLQVRGDVLRYWLDGEPVGSYVCRVLAGDPGLYCDDANDDGSVFDNFVVKAVT